MSSQPGFNASARFKPSASCPIGGPRRPAAQISMLSAALYGLGGGIIGAVATGAVTCITIPLFHPTPSHIPGHVLTNLLQLSPLAEAHMGTRTQVANVLCGALIGAGRGLVAHCGFRGPFIDWMLMSVSVWVQLGFESFADLGSAPWTWPAKEQGFELLHKAVWAFVTGPIVDFWVV